MPGSFEMCTLCKVVQCVDEVPMWHRRCWFCLKSQEREAVKNSLLPGCNDPKTVAFLRLIVTFEKDQEIKSDAASRAAYT